jgi:hypothetical protein
VLAFFRRVGEKGCWEFQGADRNRQGYKKFRGVMAHRAVWILLFGSIPEGMNVLHRCDNPACVRPDHLFLGDHPSNMQDMRKKGRHPGKPNVICCPRGHRLVPGNLIQRKSRPNHRECLTCHRERMRRSR